MLLPSLTQRVDVFVGKAVHPTRGYQKMYADHVQQAHLGADLDFLVGGSGQSDRQFSLCLASRCRAGRGHVMVRTSPSAVLGGYFGPARWILIARKPRVPCTVTRQTASARACLMALW